ncbi:MAG: hypothetical protein K9I34_07355 [Bacteroidales bacterium]|nr:hypothetical protein [Bacteroidales bacterium]
MKFYYFFLLFLFGSTLCSAQFFNPYKNKNPTNKALTIEKTYGNPTDISRLQLKLYPVSVLHCPSLVYHVGFGGGASYHFRELLDIDLSYTSYYANLNSDETISSTFLVGGAHTEWQNFAYSHLDNLYLKPMHAKVLELGVGYIVSDKVIRKTTTFFLNKKSLLIQFILGHVVQHYLEYENKIREVEKFRTGYMYMNNYLTIKKYNDENDKVYYSTDGVKFSFEGVKYPNLDYGQFPTTIEMEYSSLLSSIYLPFTAHYFYLGYSREIMVNTILEIEKWGRKFDRSRKELFVDLIIGVPNYGSFEYYAANPSALAYEEEVTNQTERYEFDFERSDLIASPIGFRVGFEYRGSDFSRFSRNKSLRQLTGHKLLYVKWKGSIGVLPSAHIMKSWFIDLGFTISINPI